MQYLFSENQRNIHTSVREICEFIFRTGSIRSGGSDIPEKAMLRGAEIHRALQRRYKKENRCYISEKHINYTEEFAGFEYELSGSIDGILENGDATVIDEFKTTKKDLEGIEWDTVKAYSAQLMCYGYMYAVNNSLNFITLRLTFFNCNTEETKTIEKEFTFTDLRLWFVGLITEHLKWAELIYNHKMLRNKTLCDMNFPFCEFRKGQRELSISVYKCIRSGRRLFAEAPTGIGKTVSTLFPSMKAIGENKAEKVFFLAAKNTGAKAAEKAVGLFRNAGASINSITITAKEKIFPCERNCLPSECEYSLGHYDRVNDALYELVSTNSEINAEAIVEIAKKHKVCPFELQLDASEFCDVIIGDYNYAFDPKARLQRYFVSGNTEEYICLVDEAHNLVDRAREMYSAGISSDFLTKFSKAFKGLRKLKNRLTKCISVLNKYRDKLITEDKTESKINLSENDIEPFRSFCEAYRHFLSDDGYEEVKKKTLELFFEVSFFVEIFDIGSVLCERYIDFCLLEDNNTEIKLFCADPSEQIRMATEKLCSCIFFSATMTPYEYYTKMLGTNPDEDDTITIPSPFPPENQLCCIYKNISTRFKDRQNSIDTILDIIDVSTSNKIGNYLIFFPSYSYMMQVYEAFTDTYPDSKTVVQKQGMLPEERDAFLNLFNKNPSSTLIGFALCGGIFSEGIDLVGDRLSGAVIIGTGLPSICFEKDLLKDHFDKTIGEGLGYNYAYTYTGLNRVYQAGGRVIRTKDDKGIIVLADDRYTKYSHRRTFPSSWKNAKTLLSVSALENTVKEFWEDKK